MMSHEIIGDDMQAVILTLGAGDEVRAEAGAMMFMTDAIEMDAQMEGGFLGGLKRKLLAGESFFITYFRATGQAGKVAFAGPYPGKIIALDLSGTVALPEGLLSVRRRRYRPEHRVHPQLGAGFFGGEGFILQKIEGTGQLFIHSGGTIVPMQLGRW